MRTIIMLCPGYRADYAGNFIPSLKAIEKEVNYQYRVIYVFDINVKDKNWCKRLIGDGHIVEFIDFAIPLWKRCCEIRKLVKKYNVVIIHTQFGDKLAATILGWIMPVKVIWHWHTDGSMEVAETVRERVRRIFARNILGANVSVIAVSEDLAKKMHGYYVPNGLATERIQYYSEEEKTMIKNELGISEDKKVVLIFGWMLAIKGLDIAVEAISLLHNDCHDVVLAIACGARDIDIVKKFIADNTSLTSDEDYLVYLPVEEEIYKYHNIADVFLSASRSEGFPYSVCEAISIEKPCVVSDIKGTKWAMDYPSVESFKSGNVEACAQAILRQLKKTETNSITTDCAESKRIMLSTYSSEKMAQKIAEIYQEVL